MLVRAVAIFQAPFSLVFRYPLPPNRSGNSESSSVGTQKPARGAGKTARPNFTHKYARMSGPIFMRADTSASHRHSSTARPPALSSPAAITLSHHKVTVAKNEPPFPHPYWPGEACEGNTSAAFALRLRLLFTMSPALGAGARTVNRAA